MIMEILISDENVIKWLVKEGDREVTKTFNSFEPYFCRFCDAPVVLKEQNKHFKAHKKQIADAHAKELKEREAERKRQKAIQAIETDKLKKKKK